MACTRRRFLSRLVLLLFGLLPLPAIAQQADPAIVFVRAAPVRLDPESFAVQGWPVAEQHRVVAGFHS